MAKHIVVALFGFGMVELLLIGTVAAFSIAAIYAVIKVIGK